jgi:hypothetical protein
VGETSYATCGDLSLAYQLFGDGPVELVFVGPFISYVELFWTLPAFKAFFDQCADSDAPVGSRRGGDGEADTMAHARDLPPERGQQSSVNRHATHGIRMPKSDNMTDFAVSRPGAPFGACNCTAMRKSPLSVQTCTMRSA